MFKIRITILKSMQFVAFLWDFSQIASNHQSNTKNNIWKYDFLKYEIYQVPWNSMEFHGTSKKFHGIPWNSMELFGGKLKVPWNSMELGSVEKFHGIPWNFGSGQNSMEFHGTTDVVQMLFKKFHGTLEKVPWNFLTKKFQWALKRDFEWYLVT